MKKKRIELYVGEINYIIELLRDYGIDIIESDLLEAEDLFTELNYIKNLIKKLEGSK